MSNQASSASSDRNIQLSDITTNNASTTKHGFMPKGDNNTAHFYRGDTTQAAVTDANLSVSDVTTNDVSTSAHGFAPKLWASAWQSYTPSWTGTGSNPSIGNGTITGKYLQIGKGVWYRVVITAGSTTTFGTGSYRVSLPTTAAETAAGVQVPMGTWGAFHASNNYGGFSGLVSTTTVGGLLPSLSTSGLFGAELTNTAPSTWVNGDTINFKGFYEST